MAPLSLPERAAAIGAQARVLAADPLWDWVTGEATGSDAGQSPGQLL